MYENKEETKNEEIPIGDNKTLSFNVKEVRVKKSNSAEIQTQEIPQSYSNFKKFEISEYFEERLTSLEERISVLEKEKK